MHVNVTRSPTDAWVAQQLRNAIVRGKGREPHWKPLTAEGVKVLRSFVATGAAGNFPTSSFYKSLMLACDRAKVARFNPYKLRHSYGTLLRRGGADIADIQELLGNKSLSETVRRGGAV